MIQTLGADGDEPLAWEEGYDPPPEFIIPPPPLPDFLLERDCQGHEAISLQESLETCDINMVSNFGLSSDGFGLNSLHSISLFLLALFGLFTLSACIAVFVLWRRYHKDSRLHYLRASVSASSSFKPSPLHTAHAQGGVEQPLIYDDTSINFISSNNLINGPPQGLGQHPGVTAAQNPYHIMSRNQMSVDSFQSSMRGGFYPVPSEMETDTDSRIYEEVQPNQNDPYPPNTSTMLMTTPKASRGGSRFGPFGPAAARPPYPYAMDACELQEPPYSNVIDDQRNVPFGTESPPSNFDYSSVYYHPHQTNRTSSSTGISSSNSDQSSNLNLLSHHPPPTLPAPVSAQTPFIVRNESGAHLLNRSNLNMNRSQNNVRNHMGFLTSLWPNRLAKKGKRRRDGAEEIPAHHPRGAWPPNQFSTGDSWWLMTSQSPIPASPASTAHPRTTALHLETRHNPHHQPLLPLSAAPRIGGSPALGLPMREPAAAASTPATSPTAVNYGPPNMGSVANASAMGRMPNPDDILPEEAWTDFTGAEDWSEALTMKRARLKHRQRRLADANARGSVANCDNANNNPKLRPQSLGSQVTSSSGADHEEEESLESVSPLLEPPTPENGNLNPFPSSTSNSNASSNGSAQR